MKFDGEDQRKRQMFSTTVFCYTVYVVRSGGVFCILLIWVDQKNKLYK